MSIEHIVKTFEGTDVELLELINDKNMKVVVGDGLVTMAMVSNTSQDLAASFNYTIQQVVEQLKGTPPEHEDYQTNQAQALFLFDFRERFSKSDRGVDLANDTLRQTITHLLTQAGWPEPNITMVLSHGAYFISLAERELGHAATQADLDQIRENLAEQDRVNQFINDWANLFNTNVAAAKNSHDRDDTIQGLRDMADAWEALYAEQE
jgi:hypothetical protein